MDELKCHRPECAKVHKIKDLTMKMGGLICPSCRIIMVHPYTEIFNREWRRRNEEHAEQQRVIRDDAFVLLLKFVNKEILTGVDPALRRAVNTMLAENSALRDRVIELGGQEMAKEFWDRWAQGE